MQEFFKLFAQPTTSNVPYVETNPLGDLRELYKDCRQCGLCNNREDGQTIAFGYGSKNSKLMFIGEGPVPYDADVGRPFSSKFSSKLFGMVSYLSKRTNLDNNIYYTNLVLCPGDVVNESVLACRDRLNEEITIVNPKVIVCLGSVTANYFMPISKGKRLKGHVFHGETKNYVMVVTHSLQDCFFRGDAVRNEVKEDLDLVYEILVSPN